MDDPDHEPDVPTSDPARAARTSAGDGNGNGSDSEDDAAPDFGQLAALASRAQARQGQAPIAGSSNDKSNAVFIPKRGEKDFEPTGFAGQSRALEMSRTAMFDVISCQRIVNSKTISVATWEPLLGRAIVQLARGQVFTSTGMSRRVVLLEDGRYEDLAKAKGVTPLAPQAGTVKDGVFWPKMQSRLELMPEEALYLVERGSLECRVRHSQASSDAKEDDEMREYDDSERDADWMPMSVEQAFATLIGVEGLTRPRYQLYAYLRRLGYIVQRKTVSDALRTSNLSASRTALAAHGTSNDLRMTGIIQDRDHPLRLVTILDVLLYPVRRIIQAAGHGMDQVQLALLRLMGWLRSVVRRSSSIQSTSGRNVVQSTGQVGLLGIGAGSRASYDEIFDRLRIVPTGHDSPLPTRQRTSPKAAEKSMTPPSPCTDDPDATPQIFFYAWRPATIFKKSDPPLPEYQLAVVDARKTSLPTAFAFSELFQHIPLPLSGQELDDMTEEERREHEKAKEQRKRNDESYGRGAVRKRQAAEREAKAKEGGTLHESHREGETARARLLLQRFVRLLALLSSFFAHLPPGGRSSLYAGKGRRSAQGGSNRTWPTNVYGPLKSGRRNVIVAVNDCGTSSLIRFGEAEFERWRIAGTQRRGR